MSLRFHYREAVHDGEMTRFGVVAFGYGLWFSVAKGWAQISWGSVS